MVSRGWRANRILHSISGKKCYKNTVSGNPSAPPSASGGGQVTSSRSAPPGWDGLPRILSGNPAEKATKGHRAWRLNSLAKTLLARSPNLLGFSQEIKMQEIKGSAQGHGHNGVSPAPGFPGSCCPEEPSISPPNLHSVNTRAQPPPPSCGQNYIVTLARVNSQLDSI